jgi:hypothetical protein
MRTSINAKAREWILHLKKMFVYIRLLGGRSFACSTQRPRGTCARGGCLSALARRRHQHWGTRARRSRWSVYPMKICPDATATLVLSASPMLHGSWKGHQREDEVQPCSSSSAMEVKFVCVPAWSRCYCQHRSTYMHLPVSNTIKNVTIMEDIGIIAFASKRRPPHSIEHTQRYLNSWFRADTIPNS